MIHLGGFLVASVVVLLYNVGIEKYGNHRMDQMAQIPALEFDERDDLCAMSTADLRRTVSSRSVGGKFGRSQGMEQMAALNC